MAELILPLCRTLFLPAGCPGLGSVEAVSGDLREVRCGSTGGEAYCLGEADILVEYTAAPGPCGLFEFGGGPTRTWQALLVFPFQLCGRGDLPGDSACRVELGPLSWTMVASRAIELETTVRVSYDTQEAETESGPEQGDPAGEGTDGMIRRKEGTGEGERRGEWRMVTFNEDEGAARPELEIVDLSGRARPAELRQTLVQALAAEDQAGDAQSDPGAAAEEAVDAAAAETPETPAAAVAAADLTAERTPAQAAALLSPPAAAEAEEQATVTVPEAAAAVAETVPETEEIVAEAVAETRPEAPRPRFRGLPGLHVEAHNNDIDITAFRISIKL